MCGVKKLSNKMIPRDWRAAEEPNLPPFLSSVPQFLSCLTFFLYLLFFTSSVLVGWYGIKKRKRINFRGVSQFFLGRIGCVSFIFRGSIISCGRMGKLLIPPKHARKPSTTLP